MLELRFTDNFNGKLFLDLFGDIRMADDIYKVGTPVEVMLRNNFLGYAQIISRRDFSLKRLTEVASQINCGKGIMYQAKLLNSYYNGNKPMHPDTTLCQIVVRYTQKNMPVMQPLLHDWYENQKQLYTNPQLS